VAAEAVELRPCVAGAGLGDRGTERAVAKSWLPWQRLPRVLDNLIGKVKAICY
jgi:hypothetical protein